jgi:hypothetical protein
LGFKGIHLNVAFNRLAKSDNSHGFDATLAYLISLPHQNQQPIIDNDRKRSFFTKGGSENHIKKSIENYSPLFLTGRASDS